MDPYRASSLMCATVDKEVQHHAIELVSMLPLRPVAAATEDMQLGILHAPQQTQADVEWHEAVIASPDHQGLRGDCTKARALIGELLGIECGAFDEIVQMLTSRQHIIQTRLKECVRQIAGVEDKDMIVGSRYSACISLIPSAGIGTKLLAPPVPPPIRINLWT